MPPAVAVEELLRRGFTRVFGPCASCRTGCTLPVGCLGNNCPRQVPVGSLLGEAERALLI